MSGQIKAKVTTKVEYGRVRPPSPLKAYSSSSIRPPSPTKTYMSSASSAVSRPKSKVNSSATITARKAVPSPSATNLSFGTRANSSGPRAPSPFKPSSTQSAPGAPAVRAKVSGVARSNVSSNTAGPSLPELRQRAITTANAESSSRPTHRARTGSISSHVSATSSPAHTPRHTALSPPQSDDGSSVLSANGAVRVRSKVSHLAEHASSSTQSLPPSPSYARQTHTRPARVPSISNLSLSPPVAGARAQGAASPTLSPLGHQRASTTRDPSPPKLSPFRPHQPRDDLALNYIKPSPLRVDPAQIPLPPQSPPSSTVSFSSRSSTSRSSASQDTHASDSSRSTAPTLSTRPANGFKHMRSRSSIDGLGIQLSPLSREPSTQETSDDDIEDRIEEDGKPGNNADRKLRDEAKSNRKIADLEISNRSLLTINSSLEATKHRQAKEIRDLRRRLRESILILPPSAYHAAKSSMTEDGILKDDEDEDEDDAAAEDEDDLEEAALLEGKTDESYRRVKGLLESLLESGRRALESTPSDFAEPSSRGVKVLSEEEARTWRGDELDSKSLLEDDADAASFVSQSVGDDGPSRPRSPSRAASSDGPTSEEEVSASIIIVADSRESTPALPPITITPSPSP
ncbi:hypothetical protein EIP86_010458 [Pleurotus ostreatoroseus]|nr:hypothetical protein EIP86_010458 [Pleurotus ostreatoroseus]